MGFTPDCCRRGSSVFFVSLEIPRHLSPPTGDLRLVRLQRPLCTERRNDYFYTGSLKHEQNQLSKRFKSSRLNTKNMG